MKTDFQFAVYDLYHSHWTLVATLCQRFFFFLKVHFFLIFFFSALMNSSLYYLACLELPKEYSSTTLFSISSHIGMELESYDQK